MKLYVANIDEKKNVCDLFSVKPESEIIYSEAYTKLYKTIISLDSKKMFADKDDKVYLNKLIREKQIELKKLKKDCRIVHELPCRYSYTQRNGTEVNSPYGGQITVKYDLEALSKLGDIRVYDKTKKKFTKFVGDS